MLYIFRYFKEIQKSIFVIKTMLKCVRNFHTLNFISPFGVFRAIMNNTSAPAIPKQSCQFLHAVWIFFLSFFTWWKPTTEALCVVNAPDPARKSAVWR